MILFSRFASVSLLLAIAGCRDPAGPLSRTVIGENRISLTTSASSNELGRGEPVTLRIRVKNEGTQAITLNFNSTCQVVPFISDARGAHVIPEGGRYGCGDALTVSITCSRSVRGARIRVDRSNGIRVATLTASTAARSLLLHGESFG